MKISPVVPFAHTTLELVTAKLAPSPGERMYPFPEPLTVFVTEELPTVPFATLFVAKDLITSPFDSAFDPMQTAVPVVAMIICPVTIVDGLVGNGNDVALIGCVTAEPSTFHAVVLAVLPG